MSTKKERQTATERRRAAAASRKCWMDKVLLRERERVARWIEWYWYNRTYAFTADHSLPPEAWPAKDVEKMMQDLVRAIRRGDALSKDAPIDGWAGGQRYEIAFDAETGQGFRVATLGMKRP